MNRYVFFAILVLFCTVTDLGTKYLAEQQLASVTRRWDHPIERTVEGASGATFQVSAWLDDTFGEGTATADPPEVFGVYRVAGDGALEGPLAFSQQVTAGEKISIQHRQVTIVPGFWSHVYVQNFGAAWGFLADKDERFVRPFFLVVAVVMIGVVFSIFRSAAPHQRLLLVALPLIVGGALGNFIDRARYGYVVDFIDWYVTFGGRERHWPTFNLADVWIAIGAGLMLIEVLITKEPKPDAASAPNDGGAGQDADA